MTISLKSQKMLWGRAACRCSIPTCRLDLYENETETDDATLVGENAHIVGESDDGPRADPKMSVAERNKYGNLILLCRNHHKVIDSQEAEFTVEKLRLMKRSHEAWVRDNLDINKEKQKDDEQYADIVDCWAKLAHLEHWQAWSSSILCHGQPSMTKKIDDDLYELRGWLLNRIWPGRYRRLDHAFRTFRVVLEDFHEKFREHSVERGERRLTERFYKITEWNPEQYHALVDRYEFHVGIVQDLMLELSRAANLVCDQIRKTFAPSYRVREGRLVIQTGPNWDLSFADIVVEYRGGERSRTQPYPGLIKFYHEREKRDLSFGKGEPDDD